MVVGQARAEFRYFPDEGVALFVVVMEMHFDVGDAETHHLGNAVEQIAPVLLLRVEEAVLRALAGGVQWSVIGDARPFVAPMRNAAERCFNRRAHAQRFVVIGDCNPGTLWLRGPDAFPKAVFQIWQKPYFRVTREIHDINLPFASCHSRLKARQKQNKLY